MKKQFRSALFLLLPVTFIASLRSNAQNATRSEVATEVMVLEVKRSALTALGVLQKARFLVNVPETTVRSLATAPASKTLQQFRLSSAGAGVNQFRIASRVNAAETQEQSSLPLDAGVDFKFISTTSLQQEISLQVTSQLRIERADGAVAGTPPVFSGQPVQNRIFTAEGASVILGGFVPEADAKGLLRIGTLRNSPVLSHFVSDEDLDASTVIVVFTPHIIRTPRVTERMAALPSLPETKSQPRFTIQIGAFREEASARTLVAGLSPRYSDVFIETSSDHTLYRVRVGLIADIQAATRIQEQLNREGFHSFIARTTSTGALKK